MLRRGEMTEARWITECDSGKLMQSATEDFRLSARKLRLWACACCRRIWHLTPDERSRQAVEVAERLADGLATEDQRLAALEAALDALGREESPDDPAESAGWYDAAWAASEVLEHNLANDQYEFVYHTTCAVSCVAMAKDESFATQMPDQKRGLYEEKFREKIEGREKEYQSHLVRDIVGNPFRPVAFAPAWRTENVVGIASKIYDERDFAGLPILADALEEAGCANADILAHCREAGIHACGCWVIDLVLGKE